jgi:hypothetical protein
MNSEKMTHNKENTLGRQKALLTLLFVTDDLRRYMLKTVEENGKL